MINCKLTISGLDWTTFLVKMYNTEVYNQHKPGTSKFHTPKVSADMFIKLDEHKPNSIRD